MGGSQLVYLPWSSTELATGRYMTLPGKEWGASEIASFHEVTPAAESV